MPAGVVIALTFRAYCMAADRISSAVAGGSSPRSGVMFLHIPTRSHGFQLRSSSSAGISAVTGSVAGVRRLCRRWVLDVGGHGAFGGAHTPLGLTSAPKPNGFALSVRRMLFRQAGGSYLMMISTGGMVDALGTVVVATAAAGTVAGTFVVVVVVTGGVAG
jgi:hypothetical protein